MNLLYLSNLDIVSGEWIGCSRDRPSRHRVQSIRVASQAGSRHSLHHQSNPQYAQPLQTGNRAFPKGTCSNALTHTLSQQGTGQYGIGAIDRWATDRHQKCDVPALTILLVLFLILPCSGWFCLRFREDGFGGSLRFYPSAPHKSATDMISRQGLDDAVIKSTRRLDPFIYRDADSQCNSMLRYLNFDDSSMSFESSLNLEASTPDVGGRITYCT